MLTVRGAFVTVRTDGAGGGLVVAVAGVVEGYGVAADAEVSIGGVAGGWRRGAGEGAERLAGGGEGDGAGGCGVAPLKVTAAVKGWP